MPIKSSEVGGRIFVTGMPRSGTKLVRNMLGQHPMISALDVETEFLPMLANLLDCKHVLNSYEDFARLASIILKAPYFKYREEAGAKKISVRLWYETCESLSAAGIFDAFMRLETDVKAGGYWLDKSPSYIGHLPILRAIFPDSKLIIVVRDVRDYCASMKRAWGKSTLRAAQRWADDNSLALKDGESMHEKNCSFIRYEEVIKYPENVMRQIAKSLDLDFSPAMCTPGRITENLGNAKGNSGIASENSGTYSRYMAITEIKKIENISCETMKRFGYTCQSGAVKAIRLSRLKLQYLRFIDFIHLVKFEAGERGFWSGLTLRVRYSRSTGNRFR